MIDIRNYEPADLDSVKRLVDSTIERSYAGVYGPAAIEHFKKHHEVSKIQADGVNGCILLAMVDGQLVGTGTLTAGGEVCRMFVAPVCQGRGIGRMLLERLEQTARARGMKQLTLDASLVGHRFYERLGFKTVEHKFRPLDGGERLDYTVMTKAL